MTITTVITYHCNQPGCKNMFVFDKSGATKRATRLAATKEGWTRRGANVQYCPQHAPSASNGKVKKSTSKEAVSKKVSRKGTLAKAKTKTGVWEFGKRAEEKKGNSTAERDKEILDSQL